MKYLQANANQSVGKIQLLAVPSWTNELGVDLLSRRLWV